MSDNVPHTNPPIIIPLVWKRPGYLSSCREIAGWLTEESHGAEEALLGRRYVEVTGSRWQHERYTQDLDGVAGVGQRAHGQQDRMEAAEADNGEALFVVGVDRLQRRSPLIRAFRTLFQFRLYYTSRLGFGFEPDPFTYEDLVLAESIVHYIRGLTRFLQTDL